MKLFKSVWKRLTFSFEISPFFKWIMVLGCAIAAGVTTSGLFFDGESLLFSALWGLFALVIWLGFFSLILILGCPSPAERARIIPRPHPWEFGLSAETATKVSMLVKSDDDEEKFQIASMIVSSLDPDTMEDRQWFRYAAALHEYQEAIDKWAKENS